MILRSQADELDAIADVIERDTSSVDMMTTYTAAPPILDPDDIPGPDSMTVAEPDGRVDVTYNCNPGPESRINIEATLRMAQHDAMQGKIVMLDYGDPAKNQIWTKETFA